MRESSAFLDPISFCLLLISNLFFSLLILKRWKGRILNILIPIIYPLACTFAVIYTAKTVATASEPTSYVVLFIVSLVLLILLVKMRLEEAIFLSIFQTFHIVFAKSIVAGCMSIFYKKNMFQLFQVAQYTQLICCLSFGLMAILFCIYYLTFNKRKMDAFFVSKGQVYYVMIIHIMLALYLLFKCYNFYFNLDLIWFSVEQVYTSLTLYLVYFFVLRFGVRLSSLNQYQIREKRQDFEALNQVANFVQMQDANAFLSSYKDVSAEIKKELSANKTAEALEELNSLDNKFKALNIEDKKYSDMRLINALIQEFANVCKLKNIELNADFFIPNTINIEEKQLHMLLSILLRNSLESCLKIKEEQNRKINISNEQTEKDFIFKISNTFNKKPVVDNGYLQTSKPYSELEGLSIGYLEEALIKLKGKFKFKIDANQKMFFAELTLKNKKN